MKNFYGVNINGIPYRKKHIRKFKQPAIKTELAIRKECDLCDNDFWAWPEDSETTCATCRAPILFTLTKQEKK